MPMTAKEVATTVEIARRYFKDPAMLYMMAKNLWEEVGVTTENYSVRDTLKALYDLAGSLVGRPPLLLDPGDPAAHPGCPLCKAEGLDRTSE